MAIFNFTTGPATLPDVGTLSYNGCVFSPLFETSVSSVYVKDAANRTVKYIEYTITVDGYVTLPTVGEVNVERTLDRMERLLSQQAGSLIYSGRGINITVNGQGAKKDVAWGPVPEILDITPLGGGMSAKIKWTVKARVPPRVVPSNSRLGPILQFNFESTVSYDEAGYSQLRIAGTVEIPLTRANVGDTSITKTVDDFRRLYPGQLLSTIDLTRFRVIHRDFRISRDKRMLEFDVTAEELPWMEMPPSITVARGQFTFKPAKTGMGLANWLCTLTVTYTVPKTSPRRIAWLAFLALLRVRMQQGNLHGAVPPPQANQNNILPRVIPELVLGPNPILGAADINWWRRMFGQQQGAQQGAIATRRVFLIDLSGTEGLYLDSKTVTFSATWRLTTVFSEILLASGLWKKVPGHTENAWATSVRNISGYTSWLPNSLDPNTDAIIDFGY